MTVLRRLLLLLTALLPLDIFAQTDTVAAAQPAEDFVIASVCMASPGEEIYSALGHACLRLQCPMHGLDYVYSYESEDASHKVLDFFAGRLKMAVRAVPTGEYVAQYAAEGRGVKEYVLRLPVRVKQRLWQQMDQRLQYSPVPYDYMNRSCAVSVLQWLEQAIGEDSLQYAPWPEKYGRSRKEIAWAGLVNEWDIFFATTFIGGEANDLDVENTRKVMIPAELLEVLQGAQAFGTPLLEDGCNELQPQTLTVRPARVTPLMLSLVVLLLSLVNLRLHNVWLRAAVLVPCLSIGTFVLYLVALSNLTCTQWNWLVIPFCPLPFLLWRWRRHWALPFAAICLAWIAGMLLYPHQVVDSAHLVLAAAMAACNIEIKKTKLNE